MYSTRKRPRVSSATGTWKPRKKARLTSRTTPSVGLRTGGWSGVPGRRGELKYIDTAFQDTIPDTGTLVLLNGLQPGTGASQRIGKRALFKNMLIRMGIGVPTNVGATPLNGYVRVLVVCDKQANAAAPTVAGILQAVNAISPVNMDNRDRFVVVYDHQITIDQLGSRAGQAVKKFKKLNVTTSYNAGAAGTIADIATNSMYMLYIYSQIGTGAAPTVTPALDAYIRLRYDDS
ncbi:capsid [uncultured virus]|uniref:Capsid n=1 Tax=uncultured virus TaxID=340016 RepID=A0A2K9LSR7_9VIRU|nr:capsid [uncultured virus]